MTRKEFETQNLCPICGGRKKPGHAMLAVDKGGKVLVVRNVPALICDQCGEEWIEDRVYEEIEPIIASMERKSGEVLLESMAG